MANGKKISEQPIVESLSGDELIPFANNGTNGTVAADTIKEYAQDGLDDKYADKSDTYTKSEVDGLVDGATSAAETTYAKKEDVPTKVSELDNDAKYQTESEVNAVANTKVDKVDGKVLSSNDFTDEDKSKLDNIEDGAQVNPTKVSQLQNDLKYQTEAQLSNSLANLYDSLDSQLVDEYTHLDNKKVDKVAGKQLSTEDFTTILKQKLEQLAIDVPDIDIRLTSLQTTLDTLIDDGGIDAVINSFVEIEAFLAGITNKETLTGLLADLKSEIVSLCASTYVSKTANENIGGTKTFTNNIHIHKELPRQFFYTPTNEGEIYRGHVGVDDNGIYVYNAVSDKHLRLRDNGELTYNLKNKVLTEDNYSSILYNGTSSQFLKADGSVDGTSYVTTNTPQNITESKSFTKTQRFINTAPTTTNWSGNFANGFVFYREDVIDTSDENYNDDVLKFGVYSQRSTTSDSTDLINRVFVLAWGKYPSTPNYGLWVGKDKFLYKNNKVWHAGNDGADSGLDADLLDGLQSTAFSRYFRFNNGSLDDITTNGVVRLEDTNNDKIIGGPTLKNNGCICLNLIYDNNSKNQLWFDHLSQNIQYRYRDSSGWKSWKQLAFTDSNVASADKLTVKQLTNEDLNTLKLNGYNAYYSANSTVTNTPTNSKYFSLEVLGYGDVIQILTTSQGETYRRIYKNNAWSDWVKMASVNDAVSKLTTKQLTNKDLNDIKDVNFSSYTAVGGNTCANHPFNAGTAFNLQVFGHTSSYITQIIANVQTGITLKRYCNNNTWQPWKKMLTEDDIAGLIPAAPKTVTLTRTDGEAIFTSLSHKDPIIMTTAEWNNVWALDEGDIVKITTDYEACTDFELNIIRKNTSIVEGITFTSIALQGTFLYAGSAISVLGIMGGGDGEYQMQFASSFFS